MHLLVEMMVVVIGTWTGAALGVVVWLRRRNRLSPGVPTPAPLGWLVSPRRGAVAHRRLRRAVMGARLAVAEQERGTGGPTSPMSVYVTDLTSHAVTIDARLVLAARCAPSVRRRLVGPLMAEVARLEGLATSVVCSSLGPQLLQRPSLDDLAVRLGDRIDALEAAHRELAALDADSAHPILAGRSSTPSPRRRTAAGLEVRQRD